MIAGIVSASMSSGGGGGATGALGSPLLAADWTTQTYTLDGVSTSHTALFYDDDPYWFYGASDQVLIDADGAHYDPGGPSAQGFSVRTSAKDTFLGTGAPRTFLFEFLVDSAETFSLFSFTISDPGFDNDFDIDVNYGPQFRAFDGAGSGYFDRSDLGAMDVPTRIAVRVNATDFTVSIDGSTAEDVASLGSPHPLSITSSVPLFIWNSSDTAFVRKFEVYGNLSDADLETLSTP